MPFSHTLDRLDVSFDDAHSVANAGLVLPATLAAHLGIEEGTWIAELRSGLAAR
jgi:hypothetical protein